MNFYLHSTRDVEVFQAAALPFLRAHAAAYSQLLLAAERLNPQRLADGAYWLGWLREDGAVTAVALLTAHSSPAYLSLSEWPATAIPLLLNALAGYSVTDLVGPRATAEACCAALGLPHLRARLASYVLTDAPARFAAQGRAAALSKTRMPLLADWIVAFEIECHFPARVAADILHMLENALPPLGTRDYFFWMVEHEPVAMAAIAVAGCTARIGPVYTAPGHRGRGYAAVLVAQLCRDALAAGAQQVCLYADAANPTSNTLYQRIGFVNVGEFAEYGR